MTMAQLLLAALLQIFPYMSGNNRACIQRNFESIARVAEYAERNHHVPAAIMLSVGFLETHLGCDIGEGGNWGAPISASRRHVAGTPEQAAIVLERSYQVCHTWVGAISRFRSGLCRIPEHMNHYPMNALSIMTRISTISGTSIPNDLTR